MFGLLPPKALTAALAALALVSSQALANSLPGFSEWLTEVEREALEAGISAPVVKEALAGLEPDQRVIELSRRQAEFTESYQAYTEKRLSESRIRKGREMMAAHRDELAAVAAKYGVQPRFVVAIWGLETNYGGYSGGHEVIRSLATLAFTSESEGRRGFFRRELIGALRILDQGHVAPAAMTGSWAGAMGQGQFMPSSFFAYAEDFDGDGRRDIWATHADVFASIANYLSRHGWRDDVTWGRRVTLPENWPELAASLEREGGRGCAAENRLSKALPLSQWNALGVRRLNGDDLPERELDAQLVRPAGEAGPAYLVYGNYIGLLRYNCSNFYALTVARLADEVAK